MDGWMDDELNVFLELLKEIRYETSYLALITLWFFSAVLIYPLVNIQKAIENGDL